MPSSKITPKPRVVKEQPDDAYLAPTDKYLPVYDKPAALDAILTVTAILLLPLAAPAGAAPAQGPRTSATAARQRPATSSCRALTPDIPQSCHGLEDSRSAQGILTERSNDFSRMSCRVND